MFCPFLTSAPLFVFVLDVVPQFLCTDGIQTIRYLLCNLFGLCAQTYPLVVAFEDSVGNHVKGAFEKEDRCKDANHVGGSAFAHHIIQETHLDSCTFWETIPSVIAAHKIHTQQFFREEN